MAGWKSASAVALLLAGGAASLPSTNYARAQSSSSGQPCATIAEEVSRANPKANLLVSADLTLACLQSVPINKTAATEFVTWWKYNQIEFQSTQAFLKDPPESYQQPATDLQGGVQDIQDRIDNGTYTNEYDFEADVQALIRSAHDGHLAISTGALDVFLFELPMILASLSSDGQQLPKVYSFSDVNASQSDPSVQFSALETINGQDAISYLEVFANTFTPGHSIEPHGEWQALFGSAAVSAAGRKATVEQVMFNVFTDSWFNVTFENGTASDYEWQAVLPATLFEEFANITSGQDFYEVFVAPSDDDSENGGSSSNSSSNAAPLSLSRWPYSAYPEPFLVQEHLGSGNEEVTCYMIPEQSLAVMSISTFKLDQFDTVPNNTFSDVIESFITQTKAAGIEKVLLDVQGNPGGTPNLADEIFKHFFPDLTIFGGSRFRVQNTSIGLSSAVSQLFAEDQSGSNETMTLTDEQDLWPFIAQLTIDAATGASFASWDAVLNASYMQKGDTFTPTAQLNFSNAVLDIDEGNEVVFDFANRTDPAATRPFKAENMAILMDGTCASTCTIFVELFHHQAGVKTITAGGQPVTGPMQLSGGVRGSQDLNVNRITDSIAMLFEEAPDLAEAAGLQLPPTGITVNQAASSFNFHDQIRENETFPLQFAYQASDCRIFYTPSTFNNYTNLWTYAAQAIFDDMSMCVEGSTGDISVTSNATDTTGPSMSSSSSNSSSSSTSTSTSSSTSNSTEVSAARPSIFMDAAGNDTSDASVNNGNINGNNNVQRSAAGHVTVGKGKGSVGLMMVVAGVVFAML